MNKWTKKKWMNNEHQRLSLRPNACHSYCWHHLFLHTHFMLTHTCSSQIPAFHAHMHTSQRFPQHSSWHMYASQRFSQHSGWRRHTSQCFSQHSSWHMHTSVLFIAQQLTHKMNFKADRAQNFTFPRGNNHVSSAGLFIIRDQQRLPHQLNHPCRTLWSSDCFAHLLQTSRLTQLQGQQHHGCWETMCYN